MFNANNLAQPCVQQLTPYQSAAKLQKQGSRLEQIMLNANERAGCGIYQVAGSNINRYPEPQPVALRQAYATYAALLPEQVLITRGADEAIELLIKTFCQANQDSIVINPPTYGMYAISAQSQAVEVVSTPLVNWQLNLEAIKQQCGNSQNKLIFICNPNNPTGNSINRQDIATVLEFAKQQVVVVDEAYIEYSDQQTVADLLESYPNLVILRTLSKAFGLAGLRCGFLLASKAIIELVSKVIAPYPIASPVAELATQALAPDNLQQVGLLVQQNQLLKQAFCQWLSSQAWCLACISSDTNFVLVKVTNASELVAYFKANKVLIRDQSYQAQLENSIRITIGNEREINLVKQLFMQYFAEQPRSNEELV